MNWKVLSSRRILGAKRELLEETGCCGGEFVQSLMAAPLWKYFAFSAAGGRNFGKETVA